jgi:hypothetical protein
MMCLAWPLIYMLLRIAFNFGMVVMIKSYKLRYLKIYFTIHAMMVCTMVISKIVFLKFMLIKLENTDCIHSSVSYIICNSFYCVIHYLQSDVIFFTLHLMLKENCLKFSLKGLD